MLETIYVVSAVVIFFWLLTRSGQRRPRHAATVKSFPAMHRPIRRRRVPLSLALSLYTARLVTMIEQTYSNIMDGWQQGRIMSIKTMPSAEVRPVERSETIEIRNETVETVETPLLLDHNIIEQIELRTIATLIRDSVIKSRTRAIEAVFAVNAGGGTEYKRLNTALKDLLGEAQTLDTERTDAAAVLAALPPRTDYEIDLDQVTEQPA